MIHYIFSDFRKHQLKSKPHLEEKLPSPLIVRGSSTSALRSRSSTCSGISSSSRLSLSSRSSSVSTEGVQPRLQSLQGSGHLSSASPVCSKSSKRLEKILDKYCSITLPFYLSALTSHRQNIDKVTYRRRPNFRFFDVDTKCKQISVHKTRDILALWFVSLRLCSLRLKKLQEEMSSSLSPCSFHP